MIALRMRPWLPRLLVGLSILLSGVALTPYVQLPTQHLSWQLYARVYEPVARIVLPLIGLNFP